MKRMIIVVQLLLCSLFVGQQTVHATESGSSFYFPGTAGAFAVAVAPSPGFMLADQMVFYSAEIDKAVLQGRVNLNVDVNAFYNAVGGFYTFEKPVLGGRFQIGAAALVGNLDISANLGSVEESDDNTNIGDSLIVPALYWKSGNLHFKLAELIHIPTGDYSIDNLANLSRNYWGFDTTFSMTWLNMGTGTEISVVPGIMFNTENTETDYESGNEFHIDFMMNQSLAKNFAVGLHGYYYKQVSGDSGSGAKLGSFEGESSGIGPAVLWAPNFANGKLSLIAKWIRDIDHKNRMDGDYGQFIVGYKF